MPEWESIRGRLKKFELTENSLHQYLDDETESNDNWNKYKTEIQSKEKVKKKAKIKIKDTNQKTKSDHEKLKDLIKYVDRFECIQWKWLVYKNNFSTHLQFCQEKETCDDSKNDGWVRISLDEPKWSKKRSSVSSVFKNILNTYDKTEEEYKPGNCHQLDFLTPKAITPEPNFFINGWKRRNSVFRTRSSLNKENTKFEWIDKFFETSDSFINRIGNSGTTSNLQKEKSQQIEILDYDILKAQPQKECYFRGKDGSPELISSQIREETSAMMNRMKKLRNHLDSMRSPFRNRDSISSYRCPTPKQNTEIESYQLSESIEV